MHASLKLSLHGLLLWVIGCILWNVAGLALTAQGKPGIGPTASLGVAAGIAFVGLLLWYAAQHIPSLFGILAALCAVAAIIPVYQAVTGDPSLWPSPFWRWAGAALNGLGVVMGLAGSLLILKGRE